MAARQRRLQALRPGTLSNYISCQTFYLQFCLVFNIDYANAMLDDITAFIEWLLRSRLSLGTVKNYLAAIKTMYLWWEKDLTVRDLSSHAWQMTLRGISNTIRPPVDTRAAMTLEHLYLAVDYCSAHPNYHFLAVAITLGFFGFLRVSNLAPQTQDMFDITRHTTLGDITFSHDGLLFRLKWSKTRQSAPHAFSPYPSPGSAAQLSALFSAGTGTSTPWSQYLLVATHRCYSQQETQWGKSSPFLSYAQLSVMSCLRSVCDRSVTPHTASAGAVRPSASMQGST